MQSNKENILSAHTILLSEARFVEIIEFLKQKKADFAALQEAISKFSYDMAPEFDVQSEYSDVIVDLLAAALSPTPASVPQTKDNIYYYIIDMDFGRSTTSSPLVDPSSSRIISSPKELYTFLVNSFLSAFNNDDSQSTNNNNINIKQ